MIFTEIFNYLYRYGRVNSLDDYCKRYLMVSDAAYKYWVTGVRNPSCFTYLMFAKKLKKEGFKDFAKGVLKELDVKLEKRFKEQEKRHLWKPGKSKWTPQYGKLDFSKPKDDDDE